MRFGLEAAAQNRRLERCSGPGEQAGISHVVLPRLIVLLVAIQGFASSSTVSGADNLQLAPGLSFTDDSSSAFPIRGDHLADAESRPGHATVIFFGASHCWNTNREAERLVALYPKYRNRMTFLTVDVTHPSPPQVPLIERHYAGSIPTLVILGRDGAVQYARAGETASARGDLQRLDSLLESAVGD